MISGWENRNIHASSEVIRGISDWAEADVSVIERAPSATIAPGNPARAALHIALSERVAAEARHQHAEQAEQCGRELVIASEWVLIAFGDVDVIIAQHRVEEFKRTVTGNPLSDLRLPDDLVVRRTMRDKARAHVTAAKAAHESLVADLSQAESVVQKAGEKVVTAAIGVLVAEGVRRATALQTALNDVWWQDDRLSARADCYLRYAETSRPIKLPPDI